MCFIEYTFYCNKLINYLLNYFSAAQKFRPYIKKITQNHKKTPISPVIDNLAGCSNT